MKIQVSDDYYVKSLNPVKYDYSSKNFSYAGSLSSMDSSCDSYKDVPILKPLECNVNSHQNEHGLYSVKNASIHQFNECTNLNNGRSEPTSNLIVMSYEACPYTVKLSEHAEYGNHPLENFYASNLSENQNSALHGSQLHTQHPKVNSLRQLKKELALKKQSSASYSNSNLNTSRIVQHHPQQQHRNMDPYFNSREILLSQDEIIASVV